MYFLIAWQQGDIANGLNTLFLMIFSEIKIFTRRI